MGVADELMHYGVVGMKWGVRKDPKKAYSKASKKLDKLDKKVSKRKDTVSKRTRTYNRSKYGWGLRKPEKEKRKLGRAQYKYEKSVRRAAKWVSQMEDEFSKTNVKLSPAQVKKGKEYVDILARREEARIDQLY